MYVYSLTQLYETAFGKPKGGGASTNEAVLHQIFVHVPIEKLLAITGTYFAVVGILWLMCNFYIICNESMASSFCFV